MNDRRKALQAIGISEETIDWLLDPCGFSQPEPHSVLVERAAIALKIAVETYSRVVGYFRPVNQWNKGKKEEFGDRRTYSLGVGRFEPNPYDELDKRDQEPAAFQAEPGVWREG